MKMRCVVCHKKILMCRDGRLRAHKFSGVDCHGPYVTRTAILGGGSTDEFNRKGERIKRGGEAK